MKAKEYAKQLNTEFEGVDVSIGSEGEQKFFTIVSSYVISLLKEGGDILKQRNVTKNESAISIIREQEQKYKSFQNNLSEPLKDLAKIDTFKLLFSSTQADLAKYVWPTSPVKKTGFKINH